MKRLQLILLLLLPVTLFFTAQYLNWCRGPFWIGSNLDPEYVYLLNASNLTQLKGVGHIDHPGTPVQVLGAVTIATVHTFQPAGTGNMQTDVLQHPEYYLNAINNLTTILNTLMLFGIGFAAYQRNHSIITCLLLQSGPFLSFTLLIYGLTRVSPEPLLFFASSFLVALIILTVRPPEHNPPPLSISTTTLMICSLLTGFGIAVKITFLPVILFFLIILNGLKQKLIYLSGVIAGFLIFTLPIIRMYPVFFSWIFKLGTHKGQYGSGAAEIISMQSFAMNIRNLLTDNPFFTSVLLLTLFVLLVTHLIPGWRRASKGSNIRRFLIGIASTQLLALLMVAKHPASHYLLPGLNLSAVSLWLLYYHIQTIYSLYISPKPTEKRRNVFKRVFKSVAVLCIIAAVIFFAYTLTLHIQTRGRGLAKVKANCMALHERIEHTYPNHARIYYYRSSSIPYALKFGNDLSRSYHSQTLQQLYRHTFFYDIWTRRFTTFDYHSEISYASIRERYGNNIIIIGTPGVVIPGFQLNEIDRVARFEAVYHPLYINGSESDSAGLKPEKGNLPPAEIIPKSQSQSGKFK